MSKFAVVIGVDRTGDLPPLKDAAAGATKVAGWLAAEGYEIALITDGLGAVRVAALYERINAVCAAGVYEQLLVYFSGHGYLNDGSEHWLLSEAPTNANEAVSLEENVHLARDCGIPNVVFVSDACRSTPQSLRADRVRGSVIFPNFGTSRTVRADVDRLFASLPGDPAYEVAVEASSKNYRALYTACLQDAFVDTADAFCRTVRGVEVLPNRSLKRLLPSLVETAALDASVTLFQRPDTIVESDDDFYIARVMRTRVAEAGEPAAPDGGGDGGGAPGGSWRTGIPPIVSDVFNRTLGGYFGKRIGGRFGRADPGADGTRSADEGGPGPGGSLRDAADLLVADMLGKGRGAPLAPNARLRGAIAAASRLPRSGELDLDRGIAVRGTDIVEVRGYGCEAYLLDGGARGADAVVRVGPMASAGVGRFPDTVVLRFGDGGGTVVSVPDGFLCSIAVDSDGDTRTDGVVQVAYTPTRPGRRSAGYARHEASVERARALVAGLARKGVFRIEREQAPALIELTRPHGSADQTLAIYAAYAVNAVGLSEEVKAIASHLRDEFGGRIPYDVALLARGDHRTDSSLASPFCPMLSQGWQLLRVFGASLPPAVARAGDHRRATLWTTFNETGMDILLRSGIDP